MVPFRAQTRSFACSLTALTLLAFAVGCAKPVYVLDVPDNIAKWKGPETPAPTVKKQGSIIVRLVGTPTMGALAYPGSLTKLMSVDASRGDEKNVFDGMVEHDHKAMAGYLIQGVGEAAQTSCSRTWPATDLASASLAAQLAQGNATP